MPDKSHIHHKFLAAGMKPRIAMVSIISISALFTIVNLAISHVVNINLVVIIDILIWGGFNTLLNKRIASYQKSLGEASGRS